MKLLKLTLFAILFITAHTASAQFNLGPMLAHDSDAKMGFGLKAKINATNKIDLSPSIGFFSRKIEETKSTAAELNADGQYYFNRDAETQIYGILGLGVGYSKITGSQSSDSSEVNFGVNLGGGAEVGLTDSIQGFAQARYTLGKSDRLGINAGVYFTFGSN